MSGMKKEPEPEPEPKQTFVIPKAEFKAPVYKPRRTGGIRVLSDGTWVRKECTRQETKEIKAKIASRDAAEDADAFLKDANRKMSELGFSDKSNLESGVMSYPLTLMFPQKKTRQISNHLTTYTY
ncbi:unnamed protein product [Thlaspi arvense]|uniref:Uncharacterized protein n=1 Tax=Thlaspi arvense TaxID=13288 RepID=A0AAU9S7E9_THLAR|nr:unnamed protein product [Thlaspi arvense]